MASNQAKHLTRSPGRPKDPPGFQRLKTLTKKELVDVTNVLIKGDMDGLRRIANDPQAPALLSTIAAIMVRMHATGDMDAFDKLLNRIIGKVRDEVHHGGSIGGTHGSTVIVTLPSNGREVRTLDVEAKTLTPGPSPVTSPVPMAEDDFDFGLEDDE